MNFKKIFLLNLVVFFSVVSYSQNTIFLNWISTDENGIKVETFENSTYLQDYQGLPSYQRITKLKSSEYYEIELFDIEYTSISDKEKMKLSNLDVSNSIVYSSDVLKSDHNYYNRILVFPYIKTGNNYKKITKFTYRSTQKKFFHETKKKSVKISSVLKDGDWYKISVSENGVFQLTFSDLQTLGINTTNLNVNSIRLYGNGGGMLPRLNSDFRHQDLQEDAIEIVDNNNNGIFESGDYLLFYGEDIDIWEPYDNYIGKYHHYKHLYDNFNYYFITINSTGNPKRIEDYTLNNKGEIKFNDKFNFHEFHEEDLTNFIKSGEQWYGEEFDADLSQTFSFSTPNIVDNSIVHIKANVAARAFSTPNFSFNYNNSEFMNIDVGVVVSGFLDDYAKTTSVSGQFSAVSDNLNIDINFNRNSSSHKGWLNYIEVCGFRDLTMSGSQMNFRKTISSGGNQTYGLILENVIPSLKVWNVTDPTNVTNHELYVPPNLLNTVTFGYDMSIGLSDEKFIAFTGTEYKTPNLIGYVPNQDLHGDIDVKMIIVAHPNFLSSAQALADFHFQKDGSKSKVVTPQQVYNEFSSGKQDISAIRDYCKYLYDLPDRMFKYLLIIGDASYDPKDRIPNNTNFVITYQSNNSLGPLDTYSTDDYFGYLDNNEGELNNDLVDIGIGRLPAKTLQEANGMVNKIIHYHDKESIGSWRNY
ncbi:MAG: type IX secretion system sortase PorU, partial [Flavobacteriales bacterium]|nr:type IX secretion system sortase PorU [Flavobacteriales bacterium]